MSEMTEIAGAKKRESKQILLTNKHNLKFGRDIDMKQKKRGVD